MALIFKRRRLAFKKPNREDWLFGLFLLMTFLISFTKISVPAIHKFELTLSDIMLILAVCMSVIMNKGLRRGYFPFFALLLIFTSICIGTSAMVKDWKGFFVSLVPFAFSIMISYSTLSFFSSKELLKRFSSFRNVLVAVLILSAIPVYIQFFTGIKLTAFYDKYEWRYSFLAQNPNQYGVSFLVFFYLLTLITLKLFPKDLFKLLVFQLFFFIPAFFSGSKTTTIVFTVNYVVVLAFYFYKSSIVKKGVFTGVVFIAALFAFKPIMDTINQTDGGQIRRALSIYDAISDPDFEVGGGTGHSMDAAIELFKEFPILGVGLGNKPIYSKERGYKKAHLEIHNTFLLFLAESGIIGVFVFFILFFLTPVYAIFSRAPLHFKVMVIIIYVLFAAQNWTAMLFRQRWVWLFLCISFILVNIDNKGNYQRSRLSLFNGLNKGKNKV